MKTSIFINYESASKSCDMTKIIWSPE